METMHHAEMQDQVRVTNDKHVSLYRSVGDSQEKITHLQRKVDSQSLVYFPQEDTALTLFRAKLFEAESAAARAGAACRSGRRAQSSGSRSSCQCTCC